MMNVLDLAKRAGPEVIRIRREIHRYPELGFEERRTAQLVATELGKLGIEVQAGVARTGVVGILRGSQKGGTVALRADMDALPIPEQTHLPFKSQIAGAMHACGHDAHTACLIGAAMILSQLRGELRGKVKLIFQPSEESPPSGAKLMVEEGVLEDPGVDAIMSLHSDPAIGSGKVGVRYGAMFAAVDNFTITILGEGGHAARPHDSVDAIVVASQAVLALQTIPSRRVDPLASVVITIGTIEGGYRSNIIADRVELTGTVRTLSPGWRETVPRLVEETLSGVSKSHGARCELRFDSVTPVLVNDDGMTSLVQKVGRDLLGDENVIEIDKPCMGGEDYAFYLEKVPGVMFRLGTGGQESSAYPWHHPKFDIDESSLPVGAAVLAQSALEYLKGG